MTQDEYNGRYIGLEEPDPFELEYCVTDKTGEDIPCTIKGFYVMEREEIKELTILDQHQNNITNLFNDKNTLEDIEAFVINYYFN